MLALGLSLLASLTFGTTSVLIHRGLRGIDPFSGLVIDLTCNSLLLWVFLFLFYGFSDLWVQTNLIFVGAGLLVPGLFRLMAFKGIERLGASVSTSVLNTSPLFAVLLAMVVLAERPGLANFLGAISIVGGLVCLSWRGQAKRWRTQDLIFPLSAALLAALRDNLVRLGLLAGPAPVVGATLAATTSAMTMAVFYFPRLGLGRLKVAQRTSLWCFVLIGSVHFVAYVLMFTALGLADVSVVSPIIHCFSLFTLGLSYFFLRDSDPVTPRKVLATAMVVSGVLLIAWAKL